MKRFEDFILSEMGYSHYLFLFRGNPLSVAFTEDIDCEPPLRLSVKIKVSELVKVFDKDDLNVVCSGNIFKIQFIQDRIPTTSFNALMGRKYILTVSNVLDLAGNAMSDYTYTSNFVCSPPAPKLNITHLSGQDKRYLPDHPMVFEAVIKNDLTADEKWTSTYLELGLDLR